MCILVVESDKLHITHKHCAVRPVLIVCVYFSCGALTLHIPHVHCTVRPVLTACVIFSCGALTLHIPRTPLFAFSFTFLLLSSMCTTTRCQTVSFFISKITKKRQYSPPLFSIQRHFLLHCSQGLLPLILRDHFFSAYCAPNLPRWAIVGSEIRKGKFIVHSVTLGGKPRPARPPLEDTLSATTYRHVFQVESTRLGSPHPSKESKHHKSSSEHPRGKFFESTEAHGLSDECPADAPSFPPGEGVKQRSQCSPTAYANFFAPESDHDPP